MLGRVTENDKKTSFENNFIMAIGLGGEKCCIIGTKWWGV
jgi:hypothetical protein